MDNSEKTLDQLVALCKGRGFVYPGSEIYGGLANTWDYGPLGVLFLNNIKGAWLNLRKTSKKLGERNSSRKTNTM